MNKMKFKLRFKQNRIVHWASRYSYSRSEEDIAAAETLMEKGHLRHALFFAHLAIEKILKAHVTRKTGDVPPRIHNLVRLAEMAEVALDPKRADFLRRFNLYQLEGRYPEMFEARLDAETANERLASAREMVEWLTARL